MGVFSLCQATSRGAAFIVAARLAQRQMRVRCCKTAQQACRINLYLCSGADFDAVVGGALSVVVEWGGREDAV